MARFSLVLPTLRRPDTLAHALATLCAQASDDIEIVVQNNGSDPETKAVVERARDDRIRHFSTAEVLPMSDNWEQALSNSTGDYVTFVGDDDGLLPDACELASAAFEASELEILSWEPSSFYWPSVADAAWRGHLQVRFSPRLVVAPLFARPRVERVFAFELHYSQLPMIYNSFVARTVTERIRTRYGRYFNGTSPDVTSGVLNALALERFGKANRPLSVAGISHHSLGHRHTQFGTAPSREELAQDFPLLAEELESSAGSLEYGIAADLAYIKRTLLADDDELQLDTRGMIRTVAAGANNNPSRYDDVVALVRRLAAEAGLDLDSIWIPERGARPSPPSLGPHVGAADDTLFVFDGEALRLETIVDAVALASQLAVPARAEGVDGFPGKQGPFLQPAFDPHRRPRVPTAGTRPGWRPARPPPG